MPTSANGRKRTGKSALMKFGIELMPKATMQSTRPEITACSMICESSDTVVTLLPSTPASL